MAIICGPTTDPLPIIITLVTCPDCAGSGNIATRVDYDRETGRYVYDERTCHACSGFGAVSDTDAVVCVSCDQRTTWRGTRCPLHDDLCDDCLPSGKCGDCDHE